MAKKKQDHYKDIGKTLKDCRESVNLSVREVADALHVRTKYIEAIEAGDLSTLPSEVYVRGYIRNYAPLVGLNANELLGRFEKPVQATVSTSAYYYPVPTKTHNAPSGHIMILSALCTVLALIYWYGFESSAPPPAEKVEKLPPKFEAMLYGDPERVQSIMRRLTRCFDAQDGRPYPFCTDISVESGDILLIAGGAQ